MNESAIIMYLRKGNKWAKRPSHIQATGNWGHKKGVLLAFKHWNKELSISEIYIGYSLRNNKEDSVKNNNFNKDRAIEIARGRAHSLSPLPVVEYTIKSIISGFIPDFTTTNTVNILKEIPDSIKPQLKTFIDKCERRYKTSSLTPFWKNMQGLLQEENNDSS